MSRGPKHPNKEAERLKEKRSIVDPKCGKQEDDKISVCSRVDGNYCGVYAYPAAKWRNGDCPMADSFLRTEQLVEEVGKVRVGQQKQKKRR